MNRSRAAQKQCLPPTRAPYRGNLSIRKWAKAPACLFVLKFKKMRPDVPCAFLKFKKMGLDVPCALTKWDFLIGRFAL